jgi:hypothetical protein
MRSSNDRLPYAQTIVCNLMNLPHTRRSSKAPVQAPVGTRSSKRISGTPTRSRGGTSKDGGGGVFDGGANQAEMPRRGQTQATEATSTAHVAMALAASDDDQAMAGDGADSDSPSEGPEEAAATAADAAATAAAVSAQYAHQLSADMVSNPAALLTPNDVANLKSVEPKILVAFIEARGIRCGRRMDTMVKAIKKFQSEQQATAEDPQAAGASDASAGAPEVAALVEAAGAPEVATVEEAAPDPGLAGGSVAAAGDVAMSAADAAVGPELAAVPLLPVDALGNAVPEDSRSRRVFLHAALTALIVPIPSDDHLFTKTIVSDIKTILLDLQTIVCQTFRRSYQPSDDRVRPSGDRMRSSDDRMRSSDDRMRSSDDRLSDLQTIVCQTFRRSCQTFIRSYHPLDDRMRSSGDRLRSSDDRLSDLQTIL